MIKLQIYCVVLLIFFVGKISAQVEEDIRMWASEIIENMAADAEEEGDYSFLLDELVRLSYSPIAINQANREDLEAIPFLTDQQIEALLFRRYQLGSFNSIFDLQMVEGLDQQTIEWLAPLLLFDKLAVERRWKYKPKGDLFVRAQS
ncbi:MAG TPA: helix-hairpin-helix domain-containing protein, partial [Marinilabiliaceae bacterium]|nr:helix-hairpin-helix domain-containing protein [Marinilabiliaceae bacterium]